MPPELLTLRDVLRWAVSRFGEAGLHFGHGSQTAYDEAAYLLLHALHLPLDRLEPFLDARLTQAERQTLQELLRRRIEERIPAAYLTHEAWLGEYRFYVDERVIVPRSHLAELLFEGTLEPWIGDPAALSEALDLCTGSGCLAVLLGLTFPNAAIDATDLSTDALAVAARNVSDYGLEGRIRLLHSDVFAGLEGRQYDLIISNPPYVGSEAMRTLPPEYRHEPEMALAGGKDGLDVVRRILAGAQRHLKPGGILAVEVGGNREAVERAFPRIPFTWIESASGEGEIFVVPREQLA